MDESVTPSLVDRFAASLPGLIVDSTGVKGNQMNLGYINLVSIRGKRLDQ